LVEEIAEIRVVETFKFYRAGQRACKCSRVSDPLIGFTSSPGFLWLLVLAVRRFFRERAESITQEFGTANDPLGGDQ